MPIDPIILDRVLRTPASRDIRASPIVTAVILSDPANAADLVPILDQVESVQARNARRILCLFGAAAVPYLIKALHNAGLYARKAGIETLWSMMLGENRWTIRNTLAQIAPDIEVLLNDKRPLPVIPLDPMETSFDGRICDLAFVGLQELMDFKYDDALFLNLDDNERDAEINRFRSRGFGLGIA